MEQSALWFYSQGPFPQEDFLTCLVQQLKTIWNKVRSDFYPKAPSHRRIFVPV